MGETPKTALHRFLTDAPWSSDKINERRLSVMNQCSQTKKRKIAIVTDISQGRGFLAPRVIMNAPFFEDADDFDYLITNVEPELVTELNTFIEALSAFRTAVS